MYRDITGPVQSIHCQRQEYINRDLISKQRLAALKAVTVREQKKCNHKDTHLLAGSGEILLRPFFIRGKVMSFFIRRNGNKKLDFIM